jgi:hypothetical protein
LEVIFHIIAWKNLLYLLTITAAFFFAFWEMKIKDELTHRASQADQRVSDFGVWKDLSKRMNRERFLKSLPRESLSKYRVVVSLKFLSVALLVIEVILLQKAK